MGDSTSSMFIFFAIIIVAYVIGATIYTVVQKIREYRRRRNG